jgi:hypothetical protein
MYLQRVWKRISFLRLYLVYYTTSKTRRLAASRAANVYMPLLLEVQSCTMTWLAVAIQSAYNASIAYRAV